MNQTFGQRFRSRRLATIVPATSKKPQHTMTQQDLADALDVSLSCVRFYERGKRLPHPIIRRSILRLWPDFDTVNL